MGLLIALFGVLRLQQATLVHLDAYDRAFPIVSGLLVAAVGALTLGEVSWGLGRRPRHAVSAIAALWFAACAVYIVVGFTQAS